jgi:hypothetical protein
MSHNQTDDPGHISNHLVDVLEQLTTDQLAHILASRRAAETAEPPPALAWETRERTVEERLYAFAQWARELGVDDRLIGRDLYGKLIAAGYAHVEALDVLRDVGIVWRPTTEDERLVRVAGEMLSDGWSKDQVRFAIEGLTCGDR